MIVDGVIYIIPKKGLFTFWDARQRGLGVYVHP